VILRGGGVVIPSLYAYRVFKFLPNYVRSLIPLEIITTLTPAYFVSVGTFPYNKKTKKQKKQLIKKDY